MSSSLARHATPASRDHSPPSILLADDDTSLLSTLRTVLERAQYQVACASSTHGALELAARHVFDLLVVDVCMPGSSDLEVLTRLRDQHKSVPAVVMTGKPSADSAVAALRLDAVDYLTKPFETRELLERVAAAVEVSHAQRALHELETQVADLVGAVGQLRRCISRPSTLSVSSRTQRQPDPDSSTAANSADPLVHLSESERQALTYREKQVVREFGLGRRVREISEKLNVSSSTTRNHLKAIYVKLGVGSQLDLAVKLARPASALPTE